VLWKGHEGGRGREPPTRRLLLLLLKLLLLSVCLSLLLLLLLLRFFREDGGEGRDAGLHRALETSEERKCRRVRQPGPFNFLLLFAPRTTSLSLGNSAASAKELRLNPLCVVPSSGT